MAKAKFKWMVDAMPTGRYRSFQKRGWPSMVTNDEKCRLVASIIDVDGDGYVGHKSKSESLRLKVRVYNYSKGTTKRESAISKDIFRSTSEAKEWAANFFRHHSDWAFPPEDDE